MPATDQYWRNLPQMHKIFAGSAILLLLATVLMMYKDESRSWRRYQIEAEDLRALRLQSEIDGIETEEFLANVSAIKTEIDKAKEGVSKKLDEIKAAKRELSVLEGELQVLARESKRLNAERDKSRADYDIAIRDALTGRRLLDAKLNFEGAKQAARQEAAKYAATQAAYDAKKADIASLSATETEAKGALAKLTARKDQLQEQLTDIRPEGFAAVKRAMKEWPIINGFNPHLKIQYDWPRDLEEEIGMVSVGRVDRCRTCHVNIKEFAAGNLPVYPDDAYHQPFSSHPNPDLYLSDTSPHPITDFGCTICHGGDGSGTSFQNAEHTPSNPAIAKAWEEDHHWHSNHFWEHPMLPKQFQEATCLKCHHNVVELGVNEEFGNSAPTVFEGYEVIRDYGCFGCHEISGFDGATPVGPDLRLEPNTLEELAKIEADPKMVAGKMRKVGPSLRHIKDKTTEEFVAYWTADPQRFRPTTRMPKFFDLTNQHDAMAEKLQPIELAAISKYLMAKSQEIELLVPKEGYQPNIERGKELFTKRGCLACHNRTGEEFAGIEATFGPDLSKINEKVKPGAEGFNWLYTWVKEPSRYHARTKMPDLYLDPTGEGDTYVDPAADIAAFLLEGGPKDFPGLVTPATYIGVAVDPDFTLAEAKAMGIASDDFAGVRITEVIQGSPAERAEREVRGEWITQPLLENDVIRSINGTAVTSVESLAKIESNLKSGQQVEVQVIKNGTTRKYRLTPDTPLSDLVRLYLSKSLSSEQLATALDAKHYPVQAEWYEEGNDLKDFIKGDEIELAPSSFGEEISDEEWASRQMVYLGRRTISRYGCYGCHDIPGFEQARPIGAALNDWGRKDTSKLAFEHIHEWMHHHGDPDGGSTSERLHHVVKAASSGSDVDESELTEAALYNSMAHHGRAGFIWQKLRQPRSYDYKKTETKGWDERLRMPKFPFNEKQIEAVSTFVLGLVASPPAPKFQYHPDGNAGAIIEGERLLAKYNCAGCHMLEIPEWEFGIDPDDLFATPLADGEEHAFELLKKIKGIRHGWTGETHNELPVLSVTGYPQQFPDPEDDIEDQAYSLLLWDAVDATNPNEEDAEETILLPAQPLPVSVANIKSQSAGRGGDLANWLIPKLVGNEPGVTNINEAWQASPPPLAGEGRKVQTAWLYQFLKNPEQLRYTTVLRMPKFNMDDDEARALADYFAAIEDAQYPYQPIPPKQREVQIAKAGDYKAEYPDAEQEYLTASWHVLNDRELCQKCHSVGGSMVTELDPTKVKRGPNLERVEKRLQPEWAQLWVYHPNWVTPYTSMPVNFTAGKASPRTELFGGNAIRQGEGAIDALFNYARLLEIHGPTSYGEAAPATETAPEAEAATDAGAAE